MFRLSPPPTFPKVDLPLAITSKNGFHTPDHPHFVITLREILATCRDPVQAAAAAKDDAVMLIKDLPEYSKFKFTPEGEMLIKDPNAKIGNLHSHPRKLPKQSELPKYF